jgi:hypothetical protein
MKTKIIITIIVLVVISFMIPNFLNNIRYKVETTIGEPNSFFSGVGLGIQKTSEPQNYYDEEYELDDLKEITINTSKYDKKGQVTIYGNVTNGAEPLKVILNDKVIYNSKMSNGSVVPVWEEFYLDKFFAVSLDELKDGENQIILISGNAVKKIKVNVE